VREITVISGKGGTGKTSLTAAFAALSRDHVLCDLDVDAPDLHLLLAPEIEHEEEFVAGHEAIIDPDKCTSCGTCAEVCQFEAVFRENEKFFIDPLTCEGCFVCVRSCPAEAIDWVDKTCGRWYISRTRLGPMVHARLYPGQENSGLLVTLLRRKARELAEARGLSTILCDGTPGIGCPVISSLSGTDLVVAITEPTPSGRSDLERVLDLCRHFGVPAGVITNKFDLNPEVTADIEACVRERGLPVVGRLPFDPEVVASLVEGRVISEDKPGPLADRVAGLWAEVTTIGSENHS